MGQINQTNTIVLYAAILIIIVAIGLGINFSRAITFPLSRLSREMERIRNFDLLGDEQVSLPNNRNSQDDRIVHEHEARIAGI